MGALGTSWMAMKTALLYTNPGVFMFGGIIMTLAGLIGTQYTKPTYVSE
jgi:FtsH-binding integral membrane protein